MGLEIPTSPDRLGVPVISTKAKLEIQKQNQTPLERFIEEECFLVPGHTVSVSDFFNRFMTSLDALEAGHWTKIKVGREIPKPFIKGKNQSGNMSIGNIAFEEKESRGKLLTCNPSNNRLE